MSQKSQSILTQGRCWPIIVCILWLAVPAFAATNVLGHMTTRQKVEYAKQLRDAGCLAAALDALCEAVEDLLPKEAASNQVIHLDARPMNPVKGQTYRFGKDPNTHTYLGGGICGKIETFTGEWK